MHTIVHEKSTKLPGRVDMPRDLQMLLLNVAFLTLLIQRLGQQTTKLLLQQFPHYLILFKH